MTEPTPEPEVQWGSHRKAARRLGPLAYVAIVIGTVGCLGAAALVLVLVSSVGRHRSAGVSRPTHSVRYLGVFEPDAPGSYAGINQLAHAIDRQPNLVSYYSHWLESFQAGFATSAAKHGALTLVQIAPKDTSLVSISEGRYDAYLRSYASAVKAFGGQVVLSFGHEMNGTWYTWGYKHTSPAVFIRAWRHVVTVFRRQGVRNATWLWTVNIIGKPNLIPSPNRWWPGKSYVNWVGIDGYYWNSSSSFTSVFGPTIADVRELTADPILIAETGAQPSVGQPAKIADLFTGISRFGLLGFIYFNDDVNSAAIPGEALKWRLSSPAALAALRRDATAFMKPPRRIGPNASSGS